MPDDRSEMEAARLAGLAKRHEQRLENATYTAAEVKVLTEAALRLGRKEALDEVEAALNAALAEVPPGSLGAASYKLALKVIRDATSGRTDPGMDSDLPQDSQAGRDACTCPPHIDGIGREKWPDCPVHTLREDA